MAKSILLIVLFSWSCIGLSQTILLDEDFTNGIPNSWSVFDEDQLVPDSSVAFVNDAWVGFTNLLDTCAVSTSYYSPAGATAVSEDYLVTPQVNLLSFGHLLSWDSKSFDANYPESYYVLLSTTDSLPASFTDTLKFVSNDSPNWKTTTVNIFDGGFANQPVYIAFKNASTDAFLLGIDNVMLTTDDVASAGAKKPVNVSVYPNPFVNGFFISGLTNSSSYQLFNIAGQMVSQGAVQGQSSHVKLGGLTPGVYFIKIEMKGQLVTQKLIKQ